MRTLTSQTSLVGNSFFWRPKNFKIAEISPLLMKITTSSNPSSSLSNLSKEELFFFSKVEIRQNTDKCFVSENRVDSRRTLSKNYKKGENHCLNPTKKKREIKIESYFCFSSERARKTKD